MKAKSSKSNIVMIGMPGCGKSTIGVILAKTLGKDFVDTDLLIQNKYGKLLQEIVDEHGIDEFVKLEADALRTVSAENAIIATGGSAVYKESAMDHLKNIGTCVYIELSVSTIKDRLENMSTRGIAMRSDETLESLYLYRVPLYEKYADITVNGENKAIEEIVAQICTCVQNQLLPEDFGNIQV